MALDHQTAERGQMHRALAVPTSISLYFKEELSVIDFRLLIQIALCTNAANNVAFHQKVYYKFPSSN